MGSSTKVVAINGKEYTKQECYVEALNMNPDEDMAWYNLACLIGTHETVAVNGHRYNQKQCYVEALRCDPADEDFLRELKATMEEQETVIVSTSDETPHVLRLDRNDELHRIPSGTSDPNATCFRYNQPNLPINGQQEAHVHEWFFP